MENNKSIQIVKWYWRSNSDSASKEEEIWMDYSEEDQIKIETAFCKKNKSEIIFRAGKDYIFDFEHNLQTLKLDNSFVFQIKRNEKFYPSDNYSWLWSCNNDSESRHWVPYDISINNLIEEAFQSKQINLKIEIKNNIFIIDIVNNYQILETDPFKRRLIIRALRNQNLDIMRTNRFCTIIDSKSSVHYFMPEYFKDKNIQVSRSVKDYFRGSNFTKENRIFNQKIYLSHELVIDLHQYLKHIIIRDIDHLKKILKEEIENESGNENEIISSYLPNSVEFYMQAEDYNKLIDTITIENLEEILIRLYTEEGFIFYSINYVLREKAVSVTNLNVYFILLQSSIILAGTKLNRHKIGLNKEYNILTEQDEKIYINLYRGARLDKELLIEHINKLQDPKFENIRNFMIFNELLSTTFNYERGIRYAKEGQDIEGLDRVLYRIQLDYEEIFRNPSIICFIEDFSRFNEKEVLFSSSCIFRVSNIQSKENYHEITLKFISNGCNSYDFFEYSSFWEFNLWGDNIGADATISLAKAIRNNTTIREINLRDANMGDTGAQSIADVLKTNSTITKIVLKNNKISKDGCKSIAEALRYNSTLKVIDLGSNNIGSEGAKCLAEALKTNSTVLQISLINNEIREEGANDIGEALKTNSTIVSIDLEDNNIELEKLNLDRRIKY